MRLSAKEFDQLCYDNQLELIYVKGIPVSERNLFPSQSIILYSVYSFFVETIVNKSDGKILSFERLNLGEVSDSYCKDIPSI